MKLSAGQVIRISVLHGILLTTGLLLRATFAPPLAPWERGLANAVAQVQRQDLDGALATTERTRDLAARRLGADTLAVEVSTRMLAELHRRSGDLLAARTLYEWLMTRVARRPGAASWIAARDEGGRILIRRRRALVGRGGGMELPSVEEGYARVLRELGARG